MSDLADYLLHQLLVIESMGQNDEAFGATVRQILRSNRRQLESGGTFQHGGPSLSSEDGDRKALEPPPIE